MAPVVGAKAASLAAGEAVVAWKEEIGKKTGTLRRCWYGSYRCPKRENQSSHVFCLKQRCGHARGNINASGQSSQSVLVSSSPTWVALGAWLLVDPCGAGEELSAPAPPEEISAASLAFWAVDATTREASRVRI